MDLTDIYRIIHPITVDYTFFPIAQWNFLQSRSHPKSQGKSQQIQKKEHIPCILTDDNGIKFEINGKRDYKNHLNSWRQNIFLNNEWIIEEIKKSHDSSENEYTTYLWNTAKAVLRWKFIAMSYKLSEN
jgi:hypothetical protein